MKAVQFDAHGDRDVIEYGVLRSEFPEIRATADSLLPRSIREDAGTLLDEMLPQIRKTSELVRDISAASEEQGQGVGQINSAMRGLNEATQQNASASEELAATAEEMGSQAQMLAQLMAFFKTVKQRHGGGDSVTRLLQKSA